jgi:hypothetical protein
MSALWIGAGGDAMNLSRSSMYCVEVHQSTILNENVYFNGMLDILFLSNTIRL